MKLLQIDSSARLSSVSRELTAEFSGKWKRENPGGEVVTRDLTKTPPPLITDEWTNPIYKDPSELSPEQQDVLKLSDTLIAELFGADTIVIGVPMYNFTIPRPLKAWIDQIVRVGKTFAYGPKEREGLLRGKKIVIITSRAEVTRLELLKLQLIFNFADGCAGSTLGRAIKLKRRNTMSTARPDTSVASRYLAKQNLGTASSIKRTSGREVSRPWNIVLWILQVLAAGAFLAAGISKLGASGMMVALFNQIGAGQWLRYLTGAFEVTGAILLLLPRATFYGAALLVCTMAGAVMTHLFVIGGNPAPAMVLLTITGVIAWKRWPIFA